ncbi:MAG: exodeoxyribonuclease VII large subunit [Candidatus Saccharimonadales bacterium]|jgi:exodeoxyribonuclease VII large subunit
MEETTITPSEFVALANQTFEYAYPVVRVVGELSNFKIAKGRWLYADLKDDGASLRLFGTVYQMPGPLESGMMVEITANPRLHQQFGFSLNIVSIKPVGEGSIKKASDLLRAKLKAEGVFDAERKRALPRIPERIALITGLETAAYQDFIKIINARWGGLQVDVYNSLVQGESAPQQLVDCIGKANMKSGYDALVIIRGGGSADDLGAFSHELVVRAVSASRIPTLVAIGHEVDESLAELASDMRASTPSNAAELLVPDRQEILKQLELQRVYIGEKVYSTLESKKMELAAYTDFMSKSVMRNIDIKYQELKQNALIIGSLDPSLQMSRGYAIVTSGGKLVKSVKELTVDKNVKIKVSDGTKEAKIL